MRFLSTRNPRESASFTQALESGLAPDGGLYIPERFPEYSNADFDGLDTVPDIADRLLQPFLAGTALEAELRDLCEEAFDFPIPLQPVESADHGLSVLELFHGPTAAFKDVGARFLSACVARINTADDTPLTILVATSGDTGGAVAAAFHGRPKIRVVVLFPEGLVSPRQEQQLTCWGDNVIALRVRGTFDDCQRLVKTAFADHDLSRTHRLTSANSINLGRLLPQTVYYAAASLWHQRISGVAANIIVPTGNVGNALACIWARHMGFAIDQIVLSTNANRPVSDYLETGIWSPRASMATLASAMDVGDPSNMERLFHLYPDVASLRRAVRAYTVTDEEIEQQIRKDHHRLRQTWCPHTATAMHAYDLLPERERAERDWIIVATAHPAKFETIVEPLIGEPVAVPASLARLLELPSHAQTVDPDLEALRGVLKDLTTNP